MWRNTTGEGDYKGVIGKRKDSRRLLSSMANFDGFQRHTIRGGGSSMISVVAMPRGKKAESRRVKYWEKIADNLSKARVDVGLCLSRGLSRANDLRC